MADEKTPRQRLIALANKYFGKKDGQSLTEFGAELKELTDEDCVQLVSGLEGANPTLTY
jgi:hypothetical protein